MNWEEIIKEEQQKQYYKELWSFVEDEYASGEVFPPKDKIFSALEETPYDKVRCVILGQDPYHDIGQAHGLAFSVNPGIKTPPSLVNIYKELADELGTYIPDNGYLLKWASQGVLLINTVLTVRAHEANSHKGKGWEKFTDRIISEIGKREEAVVFMLWGKPAQSKKKLITNDKHLVLESVHPSPLSVYRGFYGCGHFKKCNEFLLSHGLKEIDWQIENINRSLF